MPSKTIRGFCLSLMPLFLWASAPVLQAQESIRVLSMSQEVNFPKEVLFTLDAEGDTEIRQVTLFYYILGARSQVYGYPTFDPGRTIKAHFSLKTEGGAYIPPGVEIEYYYLIEDATGRELETRHVSFTYLDTRFKWRELAQDPFILVWHDRSEGEVRRVAEAVSQRLEEVSSTLGLELKHRVKAIILNSSRESDEAFPFQSETITREHVFGGFAYPRYNLFLLNGMGQDTMIHELTHLLLHQGKESPLAILPAWLDEGLAMYFESSSGGRGLALARAARGDRLIPLAAMSAVPGRPGNISTFYAQSQSIVRYLMNTYGHEKMRHFLSAINEGQPFSQAMQDVYSFGPAQLEKEWHDRVGTKARSLTSQEISSLLIVGSVALVIMILFLKRVAFRRSNRSEDME